MAPPPPSSPHSTVTPLSLSHCAARRDLCGLPRRLSLISSSCCPLGSLLDHALLSAAQQSSPHSLPLPTPPSSRRALTHSRPLLTHTDLVYPLRTAPPTSLSLSPSPQAAVASPCAVPLSSPSPPSSTPRETAKDGPVVSRRARRTEGGACVRVVRGRAAKQEKRGDEGSR